MIRNSSAAALVLAALYTLPLLPARAATAPAAAASAPGKARAKIAARKPAKTAPAPLAGLNDNLNPGQLTMADRVLTGVADCEFKQKVDIQAIPGHVGNFKLTYERKSYVMVPEETTTGAIRLVDTEGAVVWVQIPRKSMLMNQREHHRMVDDCQEDEQRIATQAAAAAGANAPLLAPSAATPASAAIAAAVAAASGPVALRTTTTTTTSQSVAVGVAGVSTTDTTVKTTTTQVVPVLASQSAAAEGAGAAH